MDGASWVMLTVAAVLVLAAIVWWRRRAREHSSPTPRAPVKPRDRRRGPRRINTSRRESFRMGKDDNDRRKNEDRRNRKPGWDDPNTSR